MRDEISIFIGTDRSQKLAAHVLEHSIQTNTSARVSFQSLADLDLPAPPDLRHKARTGFSFARFAIPELSKYDGRAIYLDADMLVFHDILELWRLDLGDAYVACQQDLPEAVAATAPTPGTRRKKQCSVMLLDCAKLDWDAKKIIAGLGPEYTYEQLMETLCILPEMRISYDIPTRWNSLEHFDDETSLIHYTDMMTQPWVYAGNPNGWLWVQALKQSLNDRAIQISDVQREIEMRFARPSLLEELRWNVKHPLSRDQLNQLLEHDQARGFVQHAALQIKPSHFSRIKQRILSVIGR